jgi:hypothetical protein
MAPMRPLRVALAVTVLGQRRQPAQHRHALQQLARRQQAGRWHQDE